MIAAPGAACVREDQDALQIVHEGSRLGEIGAGGAVLDGEALALANDAPRSSRNLRHRIGAEPLNDLVERARDGCQRGEPFDEIVAAADGFAAFDRLAITNNRPRSEITLTDGVGLIQLHWERVLQIRQNIFTRRDVHAHIVPFFGRDVRETPLHQRFAGRDDLDDGGVAGLQIALDRADQGRRFH